MLSTLGENFDGEQGISQSQNIPLNYLLTIGKMKTLQQKIWQVSLNQEIKVTSPVMQLTKMLQEHNTVFYKKSIYLNPIMSKQSDKLNLKDILETHMPKLFKYLTVMKNKEKKNCSK